MSFRSRSCIPTLALALAALVAPSPATPYEGSPSQHSILAPPAPSKAELATRFALEEVGTPYRWGGESPETGFDCSGLVRWAYGRVGLDLPHNSYALYGVGRRVRAGSIEPGDVLFFEGLGHVGLYVGKGRMVHAPETGRTVEVVRLSATNYGARLIGARRVVAS